MDEIDDAKRGRIQAEYVAALLGLSKAIDALDVRLDALISQSFGATDANKADLGVMTREAFKLRDQFAGEIRGFAKVAPNKNIAAALYNEAMRLDNGDNEHEVPSMLNEIAATWERAKGVEPPVGDDDASKNETSLDERAATAKALHPKWSDQQVADAVGCKRTTLFKPNMENYKRVKKALKDEREKYRHGSKPDQRRRASNIDRRDRDEV
jgi:hypothetical protein